MQVIGDKEVNTRAKQAGPRIAAERRSDCPVACALDLIGDKWSLLIVRDLMFGRTRYGEFEGAGENIPTNILAQRLKRLERAGIIERRPSKHPRSRHEYRLTASGKRLAPVVKAVADWGHAAIKGTRKPLHRA
jgi:DNA-binding HxlR family transcriptional regulator